MTCPKCKGAGVITLLYSREPCPHCGGTGQAAPPEAKEKAKAKEEGKIPMSTLPITTISSSSSSNCTLTFAETGSANFTFFAGGRTLTMNTASSENLTLDSLKKGPLPWAENVLSKEFAHGDPPSWIVGHIIPAMAPWPVTILADMMMLFEQEREEPEAFVASCREFADVLKFGHAPPFEWRGRSVTYFGTPILWSRIIPAGYFGLVSKGRKMALCSVSR